MASEIAWKIERGDSTTIVVITGLSSADDLNLDLLSATSLGLSTPRGQGQKIVIELPRRCEAGGVRAKWSKKRSELKVTLVDTAAEKDPKPKLEPSRPAQMPPPLAQQQLPRTFFPRAGAIFGDSREFEDLIEAVQDWRRDTSKANILSVAKLIVKGCESVGRETEIRTLGAIFMEKTAVAGVEGGTTREAFFESLGRQEEEGGKDERSQRKVVEVVDDAAQRVLEYVCENGRMPDEDEHEETAGLKNVPFHTMERGFLEAGMFQSLRRDVESHEALLKDDSEALGFGFDNTKGFIYRFSYKGVQRLREAKWAQCLLPFFDKARDDGVNGERSKVAAAE